MSRDAHLGDKTEGHKEVIAMKIRIMVYFGGSGWVRLDGAHREPSGVMDNVLSLDLNGGQKGVAL